MSSDRNDLRRLPLRRVLGECRPFRRHVLKGTGAIAIGAAAAALGPLVIGSGINRGIIGHDQRWIVVVSVTYLGLTLVQILSSVVEAVTMARFGQGYLRQLRQSLLDHLLTLDLDFFAGESSGRIVSRLTSDVDSVEQFVSKGLAVLVRAVLSLIFVISLMLTQSVPLTAAVLTVVPPLLLATNWYRRRAFRAQVALRERVGGLLGHLNESLTGLRVVQAYTAETARRGRFEEVNRANYDARMEVATVATLYVPVVEFLPAMALAVLLAVGGGLHQRGGVPVGTIVAFSLYVTQLFNPLQQLSELAQLLQSASAAFAKIFAFRDRQPEVVDHPAAGPLEPGPGRVELQGVTFRYRPDRPDVIHNLDLTIEPGERVALIGGSGAGKSTVAKLLSRFYDPQIGRVLVDGQDVTAVQSSSLRRHLLLVAQEGFLFDGTVADNISVARIGATRADVEEACDVLGVRRRFELLPDDLDTIVTNGGQSLSAGERQIVAMARALMARPRVLVLDEATSSLDPGTELLLEHGLQMLLAGRTAIIIAHRVPTALRADRVVLMVDGRIAEDGPPLRLLAANGHFTRWVASAETEQRENEGAA